MNKFAMTFQPEDAQPDAIHGSQIVNEPTRYALPDPGNRLQQVGMAVAAVKMRQGTPQAIRHYMELMPGAELHEAKIFVDSISWRSQ